MVGPVKVDQAHKAKNTTYFTFNGSCVNRCPAWYQKTKNGDGCSRCEPGQCHKECSAKWLQESDDDEEEDTSNRNTNNPEEKSKLEEEGKTTYTIKTIYDAERVQSCTRIRGSLVIDGLTSMQGAKVEKVLEVYLGMVEEITGQLKIMHSHALVSLNFLRSLRAIGEERTFAAGETNSSQAVLTVRNNNNLQSLWDWEKRPSRKIKITPGQISFHYNPKLCMSEILKLTRAAGLPDDQPSHAVTRESNGDQTMCNAAPLQVKVEKYGSNAVILALQILPNVSSDMVGRFIVFYKENQGELANRSMQYESMRACGDTMWRKTNDVNYMNTPIFLMLPKLKPAVEYIYYVQSMYKSISTTPLYTFTTYPTEPSMPLELKVNSTTDSTVVLTWKPPYHANGPLKNYVINGYWETDRTTDLMNRDYCTHKLKKEMLTLKPVTTTTTTTTLAPNTEGDCKCKNGTKKEVTEYCNAFEDDEDFNPLRSEANIELCDVFIRRFIDSKAKSLDSMDPSNVQPSKNDRTPISFQNKLGSDGRYDSFHAEVDANVTTVTITNLRHFSQYIVMVSVCPQPHPEIKVGCSRETILSFRTDPNSQADLLDADKIVVSTYNQSTNITWEEPSLVNSFVHSYMLEYRDADLENAKYTEQCVTSQSFKNNNNTHKIPPLQPGRYALRLRAISLAGEGGFVVKEFVVADMNRSYVSTIIILFIVVVFVIVAILVGFLYYWKWQINKHRVLFASVNPKYEPVYVEDHWEVPRENLTLVRQLGRGTFGSVHEGILQPDDVKCAVKTVTAVSEEDNLIFLKEATLMKEFYRAYHIVRLIGVVSKGTPVYVIMELMEKGDLKSFLLRYGGQYCDDKNTLPVGMVIKMAAEIADGMAFLEAKKFVHRDLAARNCMVAADNTIKIGDFGLARDIYETDYYRKGDKGTLPIRWMAPESIRDGIFTSHSDMWSYGVVLWEITTLAQLPYHPRTNEEVIKYIQSGQILDVPVNMHEVLRPLVRHCWRWHPSHRPKFTQVLKILDSYVDHNFRRVSYFHNGEDKSDPANVVPFKSVTDECYIYNDENDEINLYLDHSPGTSGTPATLSSVQYLRYVPNRANGHIENLR